MKKVYKYTLSEVVTKIQVPVGSTFINVALQNGVPNVWAQVPNESGEFVERVIECFGTGHLIPEDAAYLGTVLLHDDALVLHYYEMK